MKHNNLNKMVFFALVISLLGLFGCKGISENKVASTTDNTSEILEKISLSIPKKVLIITKKKNQGMG